MSDKLHYKDLTAEFDKILRRDRVLMGLLEMVVIEDVEALEAFQDVERIIVNRLGREDFYKWLEKPWFFLAFRVSRRRNYTPLEYVEMGKAAELLSIVKMIID